MAGSFKGRWSDNQVVQPKGRLQMEHNVGALVRLFSSGPAPVDCDRSDYDWI